MEDEAVSTATCTASTEAPAQQECVLCLRRVAVIDRSVKLRLAAAVCKHLILRVCVCVVGGGRAGDPSSGEIADLHGAIYELLS